jgi:hypothetical protein
MVAPLRKMLSLPEFLLILKSCAVLSKLIQKNAAAKMIIFFMMILI